MPTAFDPAKNLTDPCIGSLLGAGTVTVACKVTDWPTVGVALDTVNVTALGVLIDEVVSGSDVDGKIRVVPG